jgi:hypothetical protein
MGMPLTFGWGGEDVGAHAQEFASSTPTKEGGLVHAAWSVSKIGDYASVI